ncbi:transposable element Tcb1 transposase [Trichonephila clavipes]|nr:transposable element Tcb1 transposase [Trichonephila clavipes]
MNGGHGQRNGTTLCLMLNPALPATSWWSDSSLEMLLNCCVVHCPTHPAPGILCWSGIGFHCRTSLVRIAGTLNSQRYISEVSKPVVLPYIQRLPQAKFQQDNARTHVARNVHQFFTH